MNKLLSILITAVFPLVAHAQQGTYLTLEDYLQQVQNSSPGMEGALLLQESSRDLINEEGTLLLSPQFFTNYEYGYDKRPPAVPSFQGNKTESHNLSFGLNKQTDFGLQGSLFYDMYSSTVSGVNPIVYPEPHLDVQSFNLQLTQSLWKNGFGRSTKALVNSKTSQNKSVEFQQQYETKKLLAQAESHYWRLAIARAQIEVQKESLERTQNLQKRNRQRAQLNLIDQADVLSTDAALSERELELKNAIDQEKIFSREFNESRGQNSDVVSEQLTIPSIDIIAQLPSIQKSDVREDVKAAQAQIDVSRQNVVIARDQFVPQLDIYTRLSTNGLDPEFENAVSQTFDTNYPYVTAGLQLNVPLDFSKNSRIRNAYIRQVVGNEKNYQQTLLSQETSWQSLNQQWEDAKERLNLALKLKETQRKKLEAEKRRLQQGKSTTYQVFLNEQDLLDADLLILKTELIAMDVYAIMKTYRK